MRHARIDAFTDVVSERLAGQFDIVPRHITLRQAQALLAQWAVAARRHKELFPWLVAITPNDRVRMGLIEILHEEYGRGVWDDVHVVMLGRTLAAIGLGDLGSIDAHQGVRTFGDRTEASWKNAARPHEAFGFHLALELGAAQIHKAFYEGLRASGLFLDETSLDYFRIHTTAEEQHAAEALAGAQIYLDASADCFDALMEGVQRGVEAMEHLLNGLRAATL